MVSPMLAELRAEAFNKEGWTWQVKYDGARCHARTFRDGTYRLWSRSGRDMTACFPELDLKTRLPALLDGEIVCLDENGRSDFNRVQHRTTRERNVAWAAKEYPAKFVAFDIIECDGLDLCYRSLADRTSLLSRMAIPSANVEVAPSYTDGVALFAEMERKGWEGVIGKDLSSTYRPGKRGFGWIKVKCGQKAIFSVAGYTPGTGWRTPYFGSLLLADAAGNYVGGVGTGFTNDMLDLVLAKLKAQPTSRCRWMTPPEKNATWLAPGLTAEVRFAEITNDGQLRFPVFVELT